MKTKVVSDELIRKERRKKRLEAACPGCVKKARSYAGKKTTRELGLRRPKGQIGLEQCGSCAVLNLVG